VLPGLPLLFFVLQTPPDTGTLEDLLDRARRQRAEILAAMEARVEPLVRELEAEPSPGEFALRDLHERLDQLGPEAALLLVPRLEPGDATSRAARFRAQEIARALVRALPGGVVAELMVASERGSLLGRLNALQVLGVVPEHERASKHLAQLFDRSQGSIRLEATRSLAAQGGNEAVLQRALTDSDTRLVETVLSALAESRYAGAAQAVLHLTSAPQAAAPVASGLVRYWRSCPGEVTDEVLDALVALTLRIDVRTADRVAILDSLPEFEGTKGRDFRRKLDPVLQSTDALVREAALVCATLLGDRTARRDLLRTFDADVDASKDWWRGYQQRGGVLMRIQDYLAATRDLRQALDLLLADNRARGAMHEQLWVDLARCYVLTGKLNKAADALEEGGVSLTTRERLRSDPDFRDLAGHARYGKVL